MERFGPGSVGFLQVWDRFGQVGGPDASNLCVLIMFQAWFCHRFGTSLDRSAQVSNADAVVTNILYFSEPAGSTNLNKNIHKHIMTGSEPRENIGV